MQHRFRLSVPFFLVIVLFFISCSKKESALPSGKDSFALATQKEQSVPMYSTEIQSNPKEIVSGKKTTLTILPQTTSSDGKKIRVGVDQRSDFHVIVIDSTFTYFEHLLAKPEANGTYSVLMTFPFGGKHTLIADYQLAGANSTFSVNSLAVKGKLSMKQAPTSDLWKSSIDGINIEMKPMGNKFITGTLSMIDIILTTKQGSLDTAQLQNINGEKFHFFIVGEKSKDYFHSIPSFFNGTFMYHIFFTKADRYHGWLIFKTDNKIHTAPLTMDVKEGSKEEIALMNKIHSEYHTGTGDDGHSK
jgi:hypothetical protein